MEDYKFVSISHLDDTQIDEVVKLLLETGHYEYVSMDNKLYLTVNSFQKVQTLQPFREHTYVLADQDNRIIGFFIAATNQEMLEIDKITPNLYRDSSEVINFFHLLLSFYTDETLRSDFVLYAIAINPLWRNKGLFKLLYSKLVSLAEEHNCSRIMFTVWQSSKAAMNIYKHYGANIIGELDFKHTGFNDKLMKCCFKL